MFDGKSTKNAKHVKRSANGRAMHMQKNLLTAKWVKIVLAVSLALLLVPVGAIQTLNLHPFAFAEGDQAAVADTTDNSKGDSAKTEQQVTDDVNEQVSQLNGEQPDYRPINWDFTEFKQDQTVPSTPPTEYNKKPANINLYGSKTEGEVSSVGQKGFVTNSTSLLSNGTWQNYIQFTPQVDGIKLNVSFTATDAANVYIVDNLDNFKNFGNSLAKCDTSVEKSNNGVYNISFEQNINAKKSYYIVSQGSGGVTYTNIEYTYDQNQLMTDEDEASEMWRAQNAGQTNTANVADWAALKAALSDPAVDTVVLDKTLTLSSGSETLDGAIDGKHSQKTIRVPNTGVNDNLVCNSSASSYRLFELTSCNFTINNIILMGGHTSSYGSCIYMKGSTNLTANNMCCVLGWSDNCAAGVAIMGSDNILKMERCTFGKNVAKYSPAFVTSTNDGSKNARMICDKCSFSQNRTTAWGGGAAEIGGTDCYCYFNNSAFCRNLVKGDQGGALQVKGSNCYICMANCTVAGNCTTNSSYCGGVAVNSQFYAVNSIFTNNYNNATATPNPSDVTGSGGHLYNCVYSAVSSCSLTECRKLESSDTDKVFGDITSQKYVYDTTAPQYTAEIYSPMLALATSNPYSFYPALSYSSILLREEMASTANGNAYCTYFDGTDPQNVVMSYKSTESSSEKALATTCRTHTSESQLVTTTFEDTARKPAAAQKYFFPGCSGPIQSANFVTVVLNQASGGKANGGSSSGNSVRIGTEHTFTAIPNSGYDFVGWVDQDGNQLSTSTTFTWTADRNITITPVFKNKSQTSFNVYLAKNGNFQTGKTVKLRPISGGTDQSATENTTTSSYYKTISDTSIDSKGYKVIIGGVDTGYVVTKESPNAFLRQFTVTLDAATNGGKVEGQDKISYDTGYDGKIDLSGKSDLPVAVSTTGALEFSGWYTDASAGNLIDINNVYGKQTIIYAQFTSTPPITYSVQDHKGSQAITYDGNSYGIDILTSSPDISKVTIRYKDSNGQYTLVDCPEYKDVGIHFIDFKLTAEGYLDTEGTGTVEIKPRVFSVTSNSSNKYYDGEPLVNHNVTADGAGFVEGEEPTYTFTGSQTIPGNSPNSYSVSWGDIKQSNYNITWKVGTLEVLDVRTKIKRNINTNSDEVTYDGLYHSVEGFESTSFYIGTHRFTITGVTASVQNKIDYGTYPVNVAGTPQVMDENNNNVTSQFEITIEKKNLVINKRYVEIKSETLSKEYDGTVLVGHNYEFVDGSWADRDSNQISIEFSDAAKTLLPNTSVANEFSINWGTAKSQNYNVQTKFGKLSVNQRTTKWDIELNAKTVDVSYDGKEHVADGFTKTQFDFNDHTYTVKNATASARLTNYGRVDAPADLRNAIVVDEFNNDVSSEFNLTAIDGYVNIKKRDIYLSGGVSALNKEYDGTSDASLNVENAQFANVVEGEVLGLSAKGSFVKSFGDDEWIDDKNAENNKTVLLKDMQLIGIYHANPDNYNLVTTDSRAQKTTKANITKRNMLIYDLSPQSKNYDGSTDAIMKTDTVQVLNIVPNDDIVLDGVTAKFRDKNVANNIRVDVTKFNLSGDDLNNYYLDPSSYSVEYHANILPTEIKLSNIKANDKQYDGNANAEINYNETEFEGLVEGETLGLTANAVFVDNQGKPDKSVGVNKKVYIDNIKLTDKGGNLASNYYLSDESKTAQTTATISKAKIIVNNITAHNRSYIPGDVSAELIYDKITLTGKVLNEDLGVEATGKFENDAVGRDKTVYITDMQLTGSEDILKNYELDTEKSQKTTSASITNYSATVTGITAVTKQYDGTNNVDLDCSKAKVYVDGVEISAKVSATGLFAQKDASSEIIKVNISNITIDDGVLIYNADSKSQTECNGYIIPREISVNTVKAADKQYDGNTVAQIDLTESQISNLVKGEQINFGFNEGQSATFVNKNVGNSKDVYIPTFKLEDSETAKASNYKLISQPNKASASITAVTVTVDKIAGVSKTYDGLANASLNYNDVEFSWKAPKDNLSVKAKGVFVNASGEPDKNAQKNKTINLSDLVLTGTDSMNYILDAENSQQTTKADINQLAIEVSNITALSKAYDGTTDATLDYTNLVLTTLVSGDQLSVTATGKFANAQPGSDKTVNISNYVLSGVDKDNYYVSSSSQKTTTATISSQYVYIKLRSGCTGVDDKEYDGTTNATIINSDLVVYDNTGKTLSGITVTANANFDSKDVKYNASGEVIEQKVTITNYHISGTSANNYYVDYNRSVKETKATINPKEINDLSVPAKDKVYDASVDVTFDVAKVTSSCLVAGEDLNYDVNGNFRDKNVGNNKIVDINEIVLQDGKKGLASNYKLTNFEEQTRANITKKMITVSGVTGDNKVYDAQTHGKLNYDDAIFYGVCEGDIVNVASNTAEFEDKNVGTNKTIIPTSITLGGVDADNYEADPISFEIVCRADITPLEITTYNLGVNPKEYDGTTAVTFIYDNVEYSGMKEGDSLSLSAIGRFEDKNVGTGKDVYVDALTLGGTDAGNYTLSERSYSPLRNQGIIGVKTVSVSGVTTGTKIYDGNTNAPVYLNNLTFSWIAPNDDLSVEVSGKFGDKNVGTGKDVSLTYGELTGKDKNNYNLDVDSSAKVAKGGAITPITVNVENIKAVDVVYTQSSKATLDYNNVKFVNKLDGDELSVTATGTFVNSEKQPDKNVGKNKTVLISNVKLTGVDAQNYLMGTWNNTTASIKPAPINVSGITARNKIYDGTENAELIYTNVKLDGHFEGDELGVTATGTFVNDQKQPDKNVETNKTVYIDAVELNGADASNYYLDTFEKTTSANITKASVTVSGIQAIDKIYDATDDAEFDLSRAVVNGKVISTDDVLVDFAEGDYVGGKDVGSNKSINLTKIELKGTDKDNYSVNIAGSTHGLSSSITKKQVTISGITTNKNHTYDKKDLADAEIDISNAKVNNEGIDDEILAFAISDSHYIGNPDLGEESYDVAYDAEGQITNKTISFNYDKIYLKDTATAKASNYLLDVDGSQQTTEGKIVPKEILVYGLIADTKSYDGTDSTSFENAKATFFGLVDNDDVDVDYSRIKAHFPKADVGDYSKKVILDDNSIYLIGDRAKNYSVNNISYGMTIDGVIEARKLTITGIEYKDKDYDGNLSAEVNYENVVFGNIIPGEKLKVTADKNQFDTKDVAYDDEGNVIEKTVYVGKLELWSTASGSAKNYEVSSESQTTAKAKINPKALTVYVDSTKTTKSYDASPLIYNLTVDDIPNVFFGESILGTIETSNSTAKQYKPEDEDYYLIPHYVYGKNTLEGNYSLTLDPDIVFTISAIAVDINIVGNSAEFTFDGTEKSVKGYTSTGSFVGFDPNKVKLTQEAIDKNKDLIKETTVKIDEETKAAIPYTMGLTSDDFYYDDSDVTINKFNITDGKLLINKRFMIFYASATKQSDSFPLQIITTEKEKENAHWSVYSLAENDSVDPTSTITTNGAEAKEYSYMGKDPKPIDCDLIFDLKTEMGLYNYDVNYSCTLNIVSAGEIVITIVGTFGNYIYNGDVQTASGYKPSQETGSDLYKEEYLTCEESAQTVSLKDVGYAYYPDSFKGGSCEKKQATGGQYKCGCFTYNDNTLPFDKVTVKVIDKGSIEIHPAPLTVTPTNVDTVYDGDYHYLTSATYEGLQNHQTATIPEDAWNGNTKIKNVLDGPITGIQANDISIIDKDGNPVNKTNYDIKYNATGSTTINPRSLNIPDYIQIIQEGEDLIYNGLVQTRDFSVSDNLESLESSKLLVDHDFIINDNSNQGKEAKCEALDTKYTLSITGIENYKDTITFDWVINRHNLIVTPTGRSLPYDSHAYQLEAATYEGLQNEQLATISSWENNNPIINVSETKDNVRVSEIFVKDGEEDTTINYNIDYRKVATMKITPRDISNDNKDIFVIWQPLTYNGSDQTLVFDVYDMLGNPDPEQATKLTRYNKDTEAGDYDVKVNTDTGLDAISYTLRIFGTNNYSSEKVFEQEWNIDKKHVDVYPQSQEFTYDGYAWSLNTLTNETKNEFKNCNEEFVNDKEIFWEQTNTLTNVGEQKTQVKELKVHNKKDEETTLNYDFTFKDGTIKINEKSIANTKLTISSLTYNGELQKNTTLVVTDTLTRGEESKIETLGLGTDYTIALNDQGVATNYGKEAGEYTVIIKGLGNYDNTTQNTIDWKILRKEAKIHLSKIDRTYDGEAQALTLSNVYTSDLVNEQYISAVEWVDDSNPAITNVHESIKDDSVQVKNIEVRDESGKTVIDNNNYIFDFSEKTTNVINPRSLEEYGSLTTTTPLKYNGLMLTSELSVDARLAKRTDKLVDRRDYYIDENSNEASEAGPYTATIKAYDSRDLSDTSGNYKGSLSEQWVIEKATLVVVPDSVDVVYDGKSHIINSAQYPTEYPEGSGIKYDGPQNNQKITVTKWTDNNVSSIDKTSINSIKAQELSIIGIDPQTGQEGPIDVDNYEVTYLDGHINITPRDISQEAIKLIAKNKTYTGVLQTSALEVSDSLVDPEPETRNILVENKDFTINKNTDGTYTNQGTAANKSLDKPEDYYTTTITGTGNYMGSHSVDWTISKQNIEVKPKAVHFIYDDELHSITTLEEDSYTALVNNQVIKDEEIDFTDNNLLKNVEDADNVIEGSLVRYNEIGIESLIIRDRTTNKETTSNYDIKHDQTSNLEIEPRDISKANNAISLEAETLKKYNGVEQTSALTVTDILSAVKTNTLKEGSNKYDDYTIDIVDGRATNKATEAGTYTTKITARGNYKGVNEIKWTIEKATLVVVPNSIDVVYDGNAHIISSEGDKGATYPTEYPEESGTTYDGLQNGQTVKTITWNDKNIKRYDVADSTYGIYPISIEIVKVNGETEEAISNNNYIINYDIEGHVNITPRDISLIKEFSAADIPYYNGVIQTSELTATDQLDDTSRNTLQEGRDFKVDTKTVGSVEMQTNQGIEAGNYTVTITGTNNYKGTNSAKWLIGKATLCIVPVSVDAVYDGTPHVITEWQNVKEYDGVTYNDLQNEQKIRKVSWNTKNVAQTDVNYVDGIAATSQEIVSSDESTVISNNNYSVTYIDTGYISVTPRNFANTDIDVIMGDNMNYAGKEININFEVKDNLSTINETLVPGRDYEIIDNSNWGEDAKTYTLTVQGKGNYAYEEDPETGKIASQSRDWKILPIPLTISSNSVRQEYNGKPISIENATFTGLINSEGIAQTGTVINGKDGFETEDIRGNVLIDAGGGDVKGIKAKDSCVVITKPDGTEVVHSNYDISFGEGTLTVTPKNITRQDFVWLPKDVFEYNKTPYTPEVRAEDYQKIDGVDVNIMKLARDCALSGDITMEDSCKDDYYHIRVDGQYNYTGTVILDWRIVNKQLFITVYENYDEVVYDGKTHEIGGLNEDKPYKCVDKEGSEWADFDPLLVICKKNHYASAKDAGPYTMDTVSGDYSYDNVSVDATFNVEGGTLNIKPKMITEDMFINDNMPTYTGDEEYLLSPTYHAEDLDEDGNNIIVPSDYYIDENSEYKAVDVKEGGYWITFIPRRNYTGNPITLNWNVQPLDISKQTEEGEYRAQIVLDGKALFADGKPQEQLLESATFEDTYIIYNPATEMYEPRTVNYEFTYDLENNIETEPGKYILNVNGNKNFKGSIPVTWAVIGTEDDPEILGNVDIEVKVKQGAMKTEFVSSKSKILKNVALAEELRRAIDGDKLNIWLDVTDITGSIKPASHSLFTDAYTRDSLNEYKYYDLSMYKQLESKAEEEDSIRIEETDEDIDLQSVFDDEVIAQDPQDVRDYYIYRNHDDQVVDLQGKYEKEENTISYATNQFSDYGLAYYQPPEPEVEFETSKTGDMTGTCAAAALAIAGLALGALYLSHRRRKNNLSK